MNSPYYSPIRPRLETLLNSTGRFLLTYNSDSNAPHEFQSTITPYSYSLFKWSISESEKASDANTWKILYNLLALLYAIQIDEINNIAPQCPCSNHLLNFINKIESRIPFNDTFFESNKSEELLLNPLSELEIKHPCYSAHLEGISQRAESATYLNDLINGANLKYKTLLANLKHNNNDRNEYINKFIFDIYKKINKSIIVSNLNYNSYSLISDNNCPPSLKVMKEEIASLLKFLDPFFKDNKYIIFVFIADLISINSEFIKNKLSIKDRKDIVKSIRSSINFIVDRSSGLLQVEFNQFQIISNFELKFNNINFNNLYNDCFLEHKIFFDINLRSNVPHISNVSKKYALIRSDFDDLSLNSSKENPSYSSHAMLFCNIPNEYYCVLCKDEMKKISLFLSNKLSSAGALDIANTLANDDSSVEERRKLTPDILSDSYYDLLVHIRYLFMDNEISFNNSINNKIANNNDIILAFRKYHGLAKYTALNGEVFRKWLINTKNTIIENKCLTENILEKNLFQIFTSSSTAFYYYILLMIFEERFGISLKRFGIPECRSPGMNCSLTFCDPIISGFEKLKITWTVNNLKALEFYDDSYSSTKFLTKIPEFADSTPEEFAIQAKEFDYEILKGVHQVMVNFKCEAYYKFFPDGQFEFNIDSLKLHYWKG